MDEHAHTMGPVHAEDARPEGSKDVPARTFSVESGLTDAASMDDYRSFDRDPDGTSNLSDDDDDVTIVSRSEMRENSSSPHTGKQSPNEDSSDIDSDSIATVEISTPAKEDTNEKEASEKVDDLEGQQGAREPPDGGAKAWLVACGAFSALICSFGYLNTFGVFQSYYQRHLLADKYPSQIAWIGSIQVLLLFLGGLVSGPFTDRYGFRVIFIPSATLLVLAVMLSSICSTYGTLILTHGVLFGFAGGMIFTPTVSIVGQYFTTKRATATGLAVSGASIGGIVFPLVLDKLLNGSNAGFGMSVRILGGVMAVLLTFTAIVTSEFAPRRKRRLFLWQAFSKPAYLWSLTGFCFTILGFWAPIFFIVEYAQNQGVDAVSAFYLASIMNATSFVGRIFLAIVADRVGCYNANSIMTACTALLIFTWTAAKTQSEITAWIACYGFFQGAVMSLISPCIAHLAPRAADIGTYVGMALACGSFGGLLDTPINGALISKYGYFSASIFSGCLVLVGSICLAMARYQINSRIWAKV